MRKCKWCNGTGREQPKKKEHSELKMFGVVLYGFKMNTLCKKCHGKGCR